jgi:putative NIF3 family GTP cyclohydrolase 1 type 2
LTPLSRRAFLAHTIIGGSVAAAHLHAQSIRVTAREIIERIKAGFGPSWRETPTDTFHAGNPDVLVTGIATTVMSTLNVLQRATAAHKNLVITHEPTFWTGNDNLAGLEADSLYAVKREFIEANRLAVFRFHDNWHARRPEPMGQALAQFLGWEKMAASDTSGVYSIPPMSLSAVVKHVETKLSVHALRVIGSAKTRVTRVGFLPGTPPSNISAARLFPNVDLIIAGEQREWEGVYYAHDLVTSGQPKAMITIGHAISEDPGMKLCADWLRTFITEIPIEWIPAGEPFAKR